MPFARWSPVVCVCLGSLACQLERSWEAFQHASESAGHDTEALPDDTSGGAASSTGDAGTTDGSTGDGASDGTSAAQTGSGGAGETTDASATTGPAAVCGDGVVAGDEECDDPGDAACFQCIRDRLVFITSEANIFGDFAMGLAEVDYWCNHLAAVAGLLDGNQARFKAWISTSTESASDRLYHSRGRYVLMNGLVFAESWDDLVAGHILNPLTVDENSETRTTGAWTDTRPDGTAMPGSHCDDWTSDSDELKAYIGQPTAIDGNWTLYVGEATNPVPCQIGRSMYCFESP